MPSFIFRPRRATLLTSFLNRDASYHDAASGRVWLRDYLYRCAADGERRWTVYDSAGQVVAREYLVVYAYD